MENPTNDIQNSWGWFFAVGILLMIGGASALFAPLMVSVLVEVIAGIVFTVGGIVMVVQVFTTKDEWTGRITYLILGLFNTLAGLTLLFKPLEGLVALTLVVIVAIFVNGLIRIAIGLASRSEAGSAWVLLGGSLSVLIATYLMTLYPEISAVLLGTVLGVSLIAEGAGYVRFAFGLKDNVSVAV
ncbi:MAG: DUF308 domain-containing protein [Parvibaculaceae bacterium]|nr:DUF308 domain-containing protein [Parvibaculaceae bacterium]